MGNLSNNKLKDLEAIEPLKSFEALTHLDLFNNDICNIEDYRTKVFKLLPSLKFLDDADADDGDEGEEDEEDSDEEDSDGEDEGEMTLSDLYKKNLDDDEDGEDFVEEGEEEEDDDDIDED